MDELKIIQHRGIRVLITQQLADAYETDSQVITNNFNRNKDRYLENKHFICLIGDELRHFKTENQNDLSLKGVSKLYLWTEKGAFLHAKSLNTDVAWEVYDRLVDSYFNQPKAPVTIMPPTPNPIQELSPQLQFLINMELKLKEQDAKFTALEDKADKQTEAIQTVKEAMISAGAEQDFNMWVINSIKKIAESGSFEGNQFRYQTVWSESYKRLTDKARCNLDTLLKNAKKRAEENGATKTQVKNISKLSVISNNKRLKELYIASIREMMIAYCVEVV